MNKRSQSSLEIFSNKRLPLYTFLTLFGFFVVIVLIVDILHYNSEVSWMIGGTQLLIYLLIHAVCSLFVEVYKNYIKQTLFFYGFNFILILVCIYFIEGNNTFDNTTALPIYSALVVSFFIATMLTLLIRTIITYLKE